MPIQTYPFRCTDCAHDFEVRLPVDERDSIMGCPKCAQPSGKRDTAAQFASTRISDLPSHLSDDGIRGTSAHREWLKTPEAKAMDLTRSKDA